MVIPLVRYLHLQDSVISSIFFSYRRYKKFTVNSVSRRVLARCGFFAKQYRIRPRLRVRMTLRCLNGSLPSRFHVRCVGAPYVTPPQERILLRSFTWDETFISVWTVNSASTYPFANSGVRKELLTMSSSKFRDPYYSINTNMDYGSVVRLKFAKFPDAILLPFIRHKVLISNLNF